MPPVYATCDPPIVEEDARIVGLVEGSREFGWYLVYYKGGRIDVDDTPKPWEYFLAGCKFFGRYELPKIPTLGCVPLTVGSGDVTVKVADCEAGAYAAMMNQYEQLLLEVSKSMRSMAGSGPSDEEVIGVVARSGAEELAGPKKHYLLMFVALVLDGDLAFSLGFGGGKVVDGELLIYGHPVKNILSKFGHFRSAIANTIIESPWFAGLLLDPSVKSLINLLYGENHVNRVLGAILQPPELAEFDPVDIVERPILRIKELIILKALGLKVRVVRDDPDPLGLTVAVSPASVNKFLLAEAATKLLEAGAPVGVGDGGLVVRLGDLMDVVDTLRRNPPASHARSFYRKYGDLYLELLADLAVAQAMATGKDSVKSVGEEALREVAKKLYRAYLRKEKEIVLTPEEAEAAKALLLTKVLGLGNLENAVSYALSVYSVIKTNNENLKKISARAPRVVTDLGRALNP